jgi:hypothetical protein
MDGAARLAAVERALRTLQDFDLGDARELLSTPGFV